MINNIKDKTPNTNGQSSMMSNVGGYLTFWK